MDQPLYGSCRECDELTPVDQLTPSGYCADCLPQQAPRRSPRAPHVGPGRAAVRALLEPRRAARAAGTHPQAADAPTAPTAHQERP